MDDLKNITLEISLKPFKKTTDEYIKETCAKAIEQWLPLLKHAKMLSILIWGSDGSEILEYKGDLDDEFEWAKYIGGAVRRMDWDKNIDPEGIGLHTTNYLYTEDPPVMTYGILRNIVRSFKETGEKITGLPVRAGATFDPGPEFAKSSFKYERHNEICVGESMGRKSMVCSYALLDADEERYAGFPDGIPQDTPFGTFLGKQAHRFLTDLGFDYIWLSNGFGFGTETWGITGAIFDGKKFHPEKIPETQKRVLDFWKLFRKECSHSVETRGTNLSTGIDLATDAVDLKGIYEGDFDILPPPNSPWAAIDGDFGLELSGYMSRIAKLPDDENYLFRFYVHDPWWMNSPWIDRYEGRPHDIYLPLAIARMNENGNIATPNHLNFLTIDDSLGCMPESCPNEIIPHMIKAFEQKPDELSPIVWIYPFDEYASLVRNWPEKLFFEDWFMRGAINDGFPVSSVISTDIFKKRIMEDPDTFKGKVLVTCVPYKGHEIVDSLVKYIRSGGKVLFYGCLRNTDDQILDILGLKTVDEFTGEVIVNPHDKYPDKLRNKEFLKKCKYTDLLTGGGLFGIEAGAAVGAEALLPDGNSRVVYSVMEADNGSGGKAYWVRGADLSRMPREYERSPISQLMRSALADAGLDISFEKETEDTPSPVIMIHRHKNAFFFSGYSPVTTTKIRLKTKYGMPLLMGYETSPEGGRSVYTPERSWRAECRVFVTQKASGTLSCREIAPVSYQMRRRIEVKGLDDAIVRILPKTGFEGDKTDLKLNSVHPHAVGEDFNFKEIETAWGKMIETERISGTLIISDKHA